MAYYHHGTIRKYVASLLSTFNDIEIQYEKSSGEIISKNIPLVYTSREKVSVLDDYTSEQILSGNYSVLPRSSLALTGMTKAQSRTTNKNVKINKYKTEDTIDYLFNSVPYEFSFDLSYQCRGMNEATQIIEQICPKFNPTINIDILDADRLDEPTRVPIILNDINIENEEYSEISSNLFTLVFSLSLQGNLYPPIKSIDRVKEFRMRFSEYDNNNNFSRKSIINWDVNEDGTIENEEISVKRIPSDYPPVIQSIIAETAVVGNNNLSVIFEDKEDTISELKFVWKIIEDDGTGATISFAETDDVLSFGNDVIMEFSNVGSGTGEIPTISFDETDDVLSFENDVMMEFGSETGEIPTIGKIFSETYTAVLVAESPGIIEVQLTITDPYGNYNTMNKTITIL